MEKFKETEHVEDEEEYVLLDLDSVACQVDIPPNAPYVLSGLDTLNPVLIIGDKLKLIGEYEETIGTCYVFSESDTAPVVHEETGASEANLFMGKCIVDPNQAPTKKVKPVTSLQKIIKFRLSPEVDPLASAVEPTDFNL
ncbi:general transcription factor 3C polypeptide 6-like [Macadamia integrifolia]|uniref:general transcription factor 3C polypeptide 6-like n=1 Tax=Macadamia integrifolia TaxID=60698 RepID=UPI001C52FAB3|nr:general transcription factor 3C polypeptide 6-like [Macadamia integrifolia]XP_042519492.1 general transcription factor 3C polypeptide 6-like [Macadamia integrifolia]